MSAAGGAPCLRDSAFQWVPPLISAVHPLEGLQLGRQLLQLDVVVFWALSWRSWAAMPAATLVLRVMQMVHCRRPTARLRCLQARRRGRT